MNFPNTGRSLAASMTLLLVVATTVADAQNESYSVTDLGTLGGASSQAWWINNGNQVVGQSSDSGGTQHAFLWAKGTMSGVPGCSSQSSAVSINDAGVILGWCGSDSSTVTWNNNVMQSVPAPFPEKINNEGWIVGGSGSGSNQAWLYKNGNLTQMSLGGCCSFAGGINDAGLVVGSSRPNPDLGYDHAFASDNGAALQDLGTLGGNDSRAWDVDSLGNIIGFARTTNQEVHLTLWQGGTATDLGVIGSVLSADRVRMNSSMQIVGTSNGRAVLWESNQLNDLNSLIPADSGWILQVATSINDAGFIVGYGTKNGQTKAFLLTPQGGSNGTNSSLTIQCPSNVVVRPDPGMCSAVVNYPTPSVVDTVPFAMPVLTSSPQSGSVFPVGESTVTCSVTDEFHNVASCAFTVTVLDSDLTSLVCPPDIHLTAPVGKSSVVVIYPSLVLTDRCSTAVLTYDPPSGSSFPLGTNVVQLTASNATGEQAVCFFNVTIAGAPSCGSMADLIAEVQGLDLPLPTQMKLIRSLQSAQTGLSRGRAPVAVAQLKKFILAVVRLQAKPSTAIDADTANSLINCAQNLMLRF